MKAQGNALRVEKVESQPIVFGVMDMVKYFGGVPVIVPQSDADYLAQERIRRAGGVVFRENSPYLALFPSWAFPTKEEFFLEILRAKKEVNDEKWNPVRRDAPLPKPANDNNPKSGLSAVVSNSSHIEEKIDPIFESLHVPSRGLDNVISKASVPSIGYNESNIRYARGISQYRQGSAVLNPFMYSGTNQSLRGIHMYYNRSKPNCLRRYN